MTRPNGVNTNYTYDNLSRLLSVLHQLAGNTIDGATYTVDGVGNRTAKTNHLNSGISNYSYDSIYQLTQAVLNSQTTETYTYDAVGNRLSSLGVSPYTYNNSNQLTSIPGATYTYDNDGNTANKTDATGTTTYSWDFENRLTSVTLPNQSVVSFKYDPFGRRIRKVASATTIFVYDGDNIIEEIDDSASVLARFTQGLGIDEPLAMLRGGATHYYQADGLGSITALGDSSGSLAATFTFDSFGKSVSSSGSLTNPFRYTAREFDPEIELYYYRARYYSQDIGRFTSEDPIRFEGGLNNYSYVRNNPVLYGDASGLSADGFGMGYSAGVAVGVGGAFSTSCFYVADSKNNTGVLCCKGAGASLGLGAEATVAGMLIFCPRCDTICDMEGDMVQAEVTFGWGGKGRVTGGASRSKSRTTGFGGAGGGIGGGVVGNLIYGDCKLEIGGGGCKKCGSEK